VSPKASTDGAGPEQIWNLSNPGPVMPLLQRELLARQAR